MEFQKKSTKMFQSLFGTPKFTQICNKFRNFQCLQVRLQQEMFYTPEITYLSNNQTQFLRKLEIHVVGFLTHYFAKNWLLFHSYIHSN